MYAHSVLQVKPVFVGNFPRNSKRTRADCHGPRRSETACIIVHLRGARRDECGRLRTKNRVRKSGIAVQRVVEAERAEEHSLAKELTT